MLFTLSWCHGKFAPDDCMLLSKLRIWFLVSCVKSVGLHNFVYSEKIFSSTFFTLSTLVVNATCVSAISLDIFSFTLLWNLFLDHSNNFPLVSRSSSLTFSTIFVNCSISGLVSSGVGRLNASKKMSLISRKSCFYLCSLQSSYWCFLLFKASCSMPIYSIVIVS